jgi:hypothetical protein
MNGIEIVVGPEPHNPSRPRSTVTPRLVPFQAAFQLVREHLR